MRGAKTYQDVHHVGVDVALAPKALEELLLLLERHAQVGRWDRDLPSVRLLLLRARLGRAGLLLVRIHFRVFSVLGSSLLRALIKGTSALTPRQNSRGPGEKAGRR